MPEVRTLSFVHVSLSQIIMYAAWIRLPNERPPFARVFILVAGKRESSGVAMQIKVCIY